MGAKQSCHTANTFINVNPVERSSIDDSFQADDRLNKTWHGTSLKEAEEEERRKGQEADQTPKSNAESIDTSSTRISIGACLDSETSGAQGGANGTSFTSQQSVPAVQGLQPTQAQPMMPTHVGMPMAFGWQVMPVDRPAGSITMTNMSTTDSMTDSVVNSRTSSAMDVTDSHDFATSADGVDKSTWTTRMIRNLPNDYRRQDVLDLLDAAGIKYDFIYLPMDWGRRANLGYAFVNLISPQEAVRMESVMAGFSGWKTSSEKTCEVVWGKEDQQSLRLNVERFRNSPVMHPDVPEEYKPLIFTLGKRTPFPAPTKRIRAPREFQRKN